MFSRQTIPWPSSQIDRLRPIASDRFAPFSFAPIRRVRSRRQCLAPFRLAQMRACSFNAVPWNISNCPDFTTEPLDSLSAKCALCRQLICLQGEFANEAFHDPERVQFLARGPQSRKVHLLSPSARKKMNIHIPPGRDGLDLTQRNGRRFRGGNQLSHSSMSAIGTKRQTRALQNVRYWPIADIPSCTAHVRFWGQSRR